MEEKENQEILKIREQETTFWNECHARGRKEDYLRYLATYPNGIYKSQADACIASICLRMAEWEKKIKLLQRIRDYPEQFDHNILEELLQNGDIDESDLIDNDIITKDALRLYLNPPLNKFIYQPSRDDLLIIPKNKTDIYFVGIPGSGKSCILAGMLYAAEKRGILSPDISITHGYRYINELIDCI